MITRSKSDRSILYNFGNHFCAGIYSVWHIKGKKKENWNSCLLCGSFFDSTVIFIEREEKKLARKIERKINVYLLEEWEILQAKR